MEGRIVEVDNYVKQVVLPFHRQNTNDTHVVNADVALDGSAADNLGQQLIAMMAGLTLNDVSSIMRYM